MLAEDVEDHRGAVDHFHLHDVFQCTPLAWGEFAVHDHGVGARGRNDATQLLCLALAEVSAGIRMGAFLQQSVEHHRAGGLGKGE